MMKRTAGVLLSFMLLCLTLAGCANDKEASGTVKIPEINISGIAGSSGDEADGGTGSLGIGETTDEADLTDETDYDVRSGTEPADYTAYLSLRQMQTDLGIMEIPVLNKEKLTGQDVTLADAMFQNLETSILDNVNEVLGYYKENGIEYDQLKDELLCETEVALNDDVLSVLTHYQVLNPTSPYLWYYEGINLDITTGKIVPSMELITKAGYSSDLMTSSVSCFSDIYGYHMNENLYYFELGNLKSLPNPYEGVPTTVELDSAMAVRSVTEKPEPQGKSWDALDRFPLVFYKGKGQVSVVAMIEIPAGAGFQWCKIRLAESEAGVFAGNHIPTYGFDYWHFPKSEEAALYALYESLALSEDGITPEGVRLGFDMLYIDNLWYYDQDIDSYYIIKAVEETKTHMATYGFYAVSVFDDRMMEKDEAMDAWIPVMKGTPVIDATFLHDAEAARAVAVVSYDMNPYELWSLDPFQYIDVVSYSESEEDVPEEEVRGVYVWPRDESGTITLIAGAYNEQGVFEEMSRVYTLELEAGVGTYLSFIRSQEGQFAIRIENSNGSCLHLLGNAQENDGSGLSYQFLYSE